jgi:hypothetical protein
MLWNVGCRGHMASDFHLADWKVKGRKSYNLPTHNMKNHDKDWPMVRQGHIIKIWRKELEEPSPFLEIAT